MNGIWFDQLKNWKHFKNWQCCNRIKYTDVRAWSRFSITITKYITQHSFTKQRHLFWPMISEVGSLPLTLWCKLLWSLHGSWQENLWEERITCELRKPERQPGLDSGSSNNQSQFHEQYLAFFRLHIPNGLRTFHKAPPQKVSPPNIATPNTTHSADEIGEYKQHPSHSQWYRAFQVGCVSSLWKLVLFYI